MSTLCQNDVSMLSKFAEKSDDAVHSLFERDGSPIEGGLGSSDVHSTLSWGRSAWNTSNSLGEGNKEIRMRWRVNNV